MSSLKIRGLDIVLGKTPVIEGLDLDIEKGEFVVLLGPSGCGKSTLLTSMVPLAVYFISGRWFVRGIAAGAVKG